jgi:hypothetical protein
MEIVKEFFENLVCCFGDAFLGIGFLTRTKQMRRASLQQYHPFKRFIARNMNEAFFRGPIPPPPSSSKVRVEGLLHQPLIQKAQSKVLMTFP